MAPDALVRAFGRDLTEQGLRRAARLRGARGRRHGRWAPSARSCSTQDHVFRELRRAVGRVGAAPARVGLRTRKENPRRQRRDRALRMPRPARRIHSDALSRRISVDELVERPLEPGKVSSCLETPCARERKALARPTRERGALEQVLTLDAMIAEPLRSTLQRRVVCESTGQCQEESGPVRDRTNSRLSASATAASRCLASKTGNVRATSGSRRASSTPCATSSSNGGFFVLGASARSGAPRAASCARSSAASPSTVRAGLDRTSSSIIRACG